MDDDRCLDETFDPDRVHQALESLLNDSLASRVASTFKALADPTRVRIISSLVHAELCVGDLAVCLGMTASAVSHQLRLLREWRVVRHRREGKHIYYALDDEHIRELFQQGLSHARHT
ncbi:MAG: ArsR/SmtB family transcription factor [Chloroflexota bacterium]